MSKGTDRFAVVTRRDFLRAAGAATALTLSMGRLRFGAPLAGASTGASALHDEIPNYRSWEDVYRRLWTWDRVAKGTHFVNCWYQRGCAWNVYVKDGLVLREEQLGSYARTNADVPDFNPRGCQKGACYSHRMYDPGRLRYPLKRVGRRGAGTWRRATWQEALRDMADKSIDVLSNEGPGAIIWDPGGANNNGGNAVGLHRTGFLLDTPILDLNAEVGDHHPGAAVTCGKIVFASSADDLFYSDLVLIWGGNPVYTQIPNAHFINEARYKGAHVVTIAPDYNASAIHADQWVQVNIGSDAALGLSMTHVIIEENLHDARFIAEQTDLPFLVRKDTRRFLRESDLEDGGDEAVFYVFDRASGQIQAAPKRSLALKSIEPALEGEYEVNTKAGTVVATPVFALLRQRLAEYSPEVASAITGTSAQTIRGLARQIAEAKAATVITQSNFGKFYHGVEMERAQILVLTMCGHIGRKGSGITGFPFLTIASVDGLTMAPGWLPPKLGLIALAIEAAPSMIKAKLAGHTTEMMIYDLARDQYEKGGFIPASLFFFKHCGLQESYGSAKKYDPWMKREFGDYLAESVEKGWQIVPETKPRIFFEVGGNMLRRVRGYDKMVEKFLPELDLLVTADWRMSNTARYSDYVLPMAGWYERDDITWGTPIAPFAHVVTRATEPLAESKSDWQLHCLYLKALQDRAKERGVLTFRDRQGEKRRLDEVYEDFTFRRRYTEDNPEDFLEELFSIASNVAGSSWKSIKDTGFVRYTGLEMSLANLGNATDINPDETITANTWHTRDKLPWPTLTRRLQFYIDHEYFMELGEELPIHKDDPAIGGNYPLAMTGGHTRWSIHGSWRDEQHLLQLQRGEPLIIMNKQDAQSRGIADGDVARVWNDVGSFEVQVRVAGIVRPGQVIVYHAWEPFQFADNRSHQVLMPSPINPIQVAGGYYHLRPVIIVGEPGLNDRGTRVEVQRIGPISQRAPVIQPRRS